MKKTYTAPSIEPIGAVASLTAAFGTDPSPDVSEFPQVPAAEGSFDVCHDGKCGDYSVTW